MLADLWLETSDADALSRAIAAITRYLEMTPRGLEQKSAWEKLAEIQRGQDNWKEFITAQVHIAELPGADMPIISAVVNTFNSVSRHLDSEQRSRFALRLANVMELKTADADATDYSRLAWLLNSAGQTDRALEIIDRGLQLDPNNEYCRNFKRSTLEKVAALAKQNDDWPRYLSAIVALAETPGMEFSEISGIANTFNQFRNYLDSNPELIHKLALRLANVMEIGIHKGNATDCSRLAWILLHAGETERARRIIDRGLRLDPKNEYCLRLKTKFVEGH